MASIAERLAAALDSAKNEREIQPFLKANPLVVRNAFNAWAWNHAEALPEFPLGADGKVDFVVLSADSGQWHAIFVELKSSTARLFTKKGVPSKAMNEALSQLDDRERWIKRNESVLREALSRHLARIDAPAYCSHASTHQSGETEIRDPRTVLDFGFVVVIGRRRGLMPEDQERRASIRGGKASIATYDRLLDVAPRIDRMCNK